MKLDKRFGKPICSKILTNGKQCGYPIYQDDVCKKHHKDWQYSKRHHEEAYIDSANQDEIEKAIILLINNGYRVDRTNM
jgi:hypothetical protein